MGLDLANLGDREKKIYRSYILLTAITCAVILFVIEQILMVDYLTKTISKIVLFTLSQIIFIKYVRKTTLKEGLNLKLVDKETIWVGLLLGVLSGLILVGAFLFFRKIIDMDVIFLELATKSKITSANYLIVTTYFTFGNSFLEEFFFRGFIFTNLYKMGYKKLGYIFSSALFALYHIAIFKNWFSIELILLCMLGLFITGIVFDYVDTKSDNFLNSWAIHILADLTIVIIGYMYLF
ncbi:MAG: CPBP family intramembrane glutamic endopeptidase [Romboutsia sp.]|uniref:CPBP family intramembrane glutamic endopeptidase n=1 Tax=Romboutsia sp. TaxID=1965302 RepID=UPI003F303D27